MDTSIGIKATGDDYGYNRPRIILEESNYRAWSTLVEQPLRERKLRGHIIGTALSPPAPRVVTLAVVARGAAPGVDAMAGFKEITHGMVDQETKILTLQSHVQIQFFFICWSQRM